MSRTAAPFRRRRRLDEATAGFLLFLAIIGVPFILGVIVGVVLS